MSLPFSNFPCSWIKLSLKIIVLTNIRRDTESGCIERGDSQFTKILLTYYPICITIVRPQFVYTLFIVRLRPNMSMRREVIINY